MKISKSIRRYLSVCLSVLIVISCFGICLSAAAVTDAQQAPLIIVTGYGTPALFENFGRENQRRAWAFSLPEALLYALNDLEELLPATYSFLIGKGEELGYQVSEGGKSIMPDMFCNPDGSSMGDITHMPNDPALTSYAKLRGTLEAYEPWLCERIANKDIAPERIFIFQYDFRMSVYDISQELRTYIENVRQYTACEKVDIFALSFGGLITATYLSRFGVEGKVEDVVLNVPALGGTSFATSFIEGKAQLPVTELLEYLNSALNLEVDVYQLIKLLDGAKLADRALDGLAVGFMSDFNELPMHWGSLWDLLPVNDYNRLKPLLLDSSESAELIRKSNYIHYQVMPNYTKSFQECMDCGIRISVFTNTGRQIAFGSKSNADALVDVKYGSGATCTDLGRRFSDGYKGVYTVCNDMAHNHISPAMNIDASSAYLPENTWFTEGQGHGTYFGENCTMELIRALLFSGEKIDIHTYPEYPQFMTSALAVYGVYAKFDHSINGRVDASDTALTVTNISKLYPLTVESITVQGADITFDTKNIRPLLPGESVSIPFKGVIPPVSATHLTVTVEFVRTGCITPCGSRTLDFTIENGEAPAYDGTTTENASPLNDLSVVQMIRRTVVAFFKTFLNYLTRLLKTGQA